MQPVKIVNCPRCGAQTEYSPQNKWRPFCSERCRMIDLGKWASDEYRLPEDKRENGREDDPPTSTPPES